MNKKGNIIISILLVILSISLISGGLYYYFKVYKVKEETKDEPKEEVKVEEKYYKVTFNSNGGSSLEEITIKENEELTIPEAPTYKGYTFLGWYNENNEQVKDKITINSDITLTAKWKKIEIKQTTKPNANTNTSTTSSSTKSEVKKIFTEKHAMAIGDSMAEGLSCYGVLNKENVIFTRGRRIDNMEKDLDGVKAYNPNYLFLSYGCNDILAWGSNYQKFINFYREKIEFLGNELPNTKIIVNLILPVGENALKSRTQYQYLNTYNEKLVELLNELNVPYLDNSEYLKENEKPYANDGIHPKSFYFFKWGENMANYLKNN